MEVVIAEVLMSSQYQWPLSQITQSLVGQSPLRSGGNSDLSLRVRRMLLRKAIQRFAGIPPPPSRPMGVVRLTHVSRWHHSLTIIGITLKLNYFANLLYWMFKIPFPSFVTWRYIRNVICYNKCTYGLNDQRQANLLKSDMTFWK